MIYGLVIILTIACGVLALGYGWKTAKEVLAADAGTERMQEISLAVQIGAKAYLNRQYTTIAGVGVVILILLGILGGAGIYFFHITSGRRMLAQAKLDADQIRENARREAGNRVGNAKDGEAGSPRRQYTLHKSFPRTQ